MNDLEKKISFFLLNKLIFRKVLKKKTVFGWKNNFISIKVLLNDPSARNERNGWRTNEFFFFSERFKNNERNGSFTNDKRTKNSRTRPSLGIRHLKCIYKVYFGTSGYRILLLVKFIFFYFSILWIHKSPGPLSIIIPYSGVYR